MSIIKMCLFLDTFHRILGSSLSCFMDEGAGVYYQKESPFRAIANVRVSDSQLCCVLHARCYVLYVKWPEFNKIFGNPVSVTSTLQGHCK